MCRAAFINSFLRAHWKTKVRSRPCINRQPGKGKPWKAPLALERRSKLKSINTNMMTERNTALCMKIHFQLQPHVKMKTSFNITHICITEPFVEYLVKQCLFTLPFSFPPLHSFLPTFTAFSEKMLNNVSCPTTEMASPGSEYVQKKEIKFADLEWHNQFLLQCQKPDC